jgi:hypothetical protein
MKNRLSGCGIIVIDNPKPLLGNSPLPSHPCSHLKDMSYDGVVRYIHVQGVDKVFARNDKEMMRRHRRNILDDHHKIVFENLSSRNLSPD